VGGLRDLQQMHIPMLNSSFQIFLNIAVITLTISLIEKLSATSLQLWKALQQLSSLFSPSIALSDV
jgi:hypothetical protein